MEPMVVIAARAAEKVGKEILYAHQNRHKVEFDIESKGLDGLVTRIDRFSEELTIETLKSSYPTHSFLGEEFGMQQGRGEDADWCWIIDPLDGTKNFVHGIPQFCVSIAVQHKGVTQHGVVTQMTTTVDQTGTSNTATVTQARSEAATERTLPHADEVRRGLWRAR